MAQKNNSAPHGQGVIYTLAQKGTGETGKEPKILIGKGIEPTAEGYGKRKCKNKTITDALLYKLIDIAKQEGREDIRKSLWNSWHCQNKVYTHEGRLFFGKQCKNRFCRNCLGIRKAELINKYHPVLKDWPDAHFVTLTVKSCSKKKLPLMLRKCLQGLNRIIDKYDKRAARGKGKKLMGIRSLESNFNPYKRWYNPHLHLIVPDRETAEILVYEWLDTLAQKGTGETGKEPKILIGKGIEPTAEGYGKRKCKNKTITDALLYKLIDIAKQEGREDIRKSLWNSWHCQNKVYTHEGRLFFGKQCKNRFCRNCLGIRKAELINKYHPVLKDWPDAHFVTLTVKSCSKKKLPLMLRKCLQGLNRIIDKYDKRAARGKGKKLMGIRSLESNFNPYKRWYNPHLHLIVPDRETAEILVYEWLELWRYKDNRRKPLANRKGQKMEKVWGIDTALIEVIKYGTKVFTDPEGKEKPKGIVKIYARAFYNIIVAMKGLRLFASFGFKLPKKDKEEPTPARIVIDYQEWVHEAELQNWTNTEEWQLLFDELPNPELEDLLNWGIDVHSE